MYNAGCHPDALTTKYSNIKVCFLPANTTSKLQPLDIIKNFKFHYRELFLRYVLSKIEECDTASDVVKSVNILVAIRWVATAWANVKEETVAKCFRKAGILDSLEVISSPHMQTDSVDPFLEVDEQMESMKNLMERTMPDGQRCSVEDYLKGDDDLPICTDLDSNLWEDNSLSELGQQEPESDEDEDNDDNETIPPPLKIQNFKEAIESLENVQQFLENRGHSEEAISVGLSVDKLVYLKT